MLWAPGARAADYPSRPVMMMVPYPAGGTSDAIARLVAPPRRAGRAEGAGRQVRRLLPVPGLAQRAHPGRADQQVRHLQAGRLPVRGARGYVALRRRDARGPGRGQCG
ncbi:hypothetical protein G6F53_013992 [Rhizopus delemar]|nr:hypothetical protein G6F53_013992 [Rhizopus delemar]